MGIGDMFTRSMASDASRPPGAPRPHKMKAILVVLAAVLATVAAVVGTTYWLNRPVHLRIAVGPPYSDDVKVIQSIAQIFSRDRRYIRLRPIIMTTAAMVFGMLPMALALDEGSEIQAPMGRAIIGGVITSTLLTLIVVPVIYSLLDDLAAWARRRFGTHAPAGAGGAVQEQMPAAKD